MASLDEKGTFMVLMIIMCAALDDFILDMSEVVFFQWVSVHTYLLRMNIGSIFIS